MHLSRVASCVLACAGVTLAAAVAQAGSMAPITVEQLVRDSEVVALGRVVDVSARPEGPEGQPGIHSRVEVQVEEGLRGAAGSTVTFWVQGGRLGDRMRRVSGQAVFAVGERVVVFLQRAPTGSLWPAGMARGKWAVLEAAGQAWAAPGASLAGAHADVLADAAPLDDLLARIRATGDRP